MLSAFLCFAILPNNSYAQISEPINLPPDGQRPIYDNICAHPYISVDTFKLYNDLNGKEFYILFDKEPEYAYSTSGYFNNNYNTTTITNKKYRGIDFSDYKRREAEGKIVTFSKILKYSFYEYLHFHDGKSNIYIIPQYAFQREAALPLMCRETFDREREFSTGKEIFAPGRWNLNVWRINKKSYTHKKIILKEITDVRVIDVIVRYCGSSIGNYKYSKEEDETSFDIDCDFFGYVIKETDQYIDVFYGDDLENAIINHSVTKTDEGKNAENYYYSPSISDPYLDVIDGLGQPVSRTKYTRSDNTESLTLRYKRYNITIINGKVWDIISYN